MVSVIQVYDALRDLMNKEQKGFISPAVFNSLASIAQMNIYNEIFSELVNSKRLSKQNFDPGGDVSQRKQKREDLSYFIRRSVIELGDANLSTDQDDVSGVLLSVLNPDTFIKPADLSKIISISAVATVTDVGLTDVNPCEIVYRPSDLDRLLLSNLSAPTNMFPVAYVSDTTIDVHPEGATGVIEITYYAKPGSYSLNGTRSDAQPFYDINFVPGLGLNVAGSASRDFMLPPHYVNEIVMEMAKLLGVRLRDPSVVQFASKEEASE